MNTQTISRTACIPSQAGLTGQGIPTAYRAEHNPLSGRWMVLSSFDECMQAGLSKGAAEDYAERLNNI